MDTPLRAALEVADHSVIDKAVCLAEDAPPVEGNAIRLLRGREEAWVATA
jgi:hypothetical protein